MATYVAIDDAELDAESPVTVSLMTRLRDNALAYAGAPSGTRAMWQQTSAPLGWTKESLYNDYTPRVVTGSVSTGGSVNFSTLFGRTATDAITLTQARLPSVNFAVDIPSGQGLHHHTETRVTSAIQYAAGATGPSPGIGTITIDTGDATLPALSGTAASGGSATSFTAAIDMRVKYIDNIVAQKD